MHKYGLLMSILIHLCFLSASLNKMNISLKVAIISFLHCLSACYA